MQAMTHSDELAFDGGSPGKHSTSDATLKSRPQGKDSRQWAHYLQ